MLEKDINFYEGAHISLINDKSFNLMLLRRFDQKKNGHLIYNFLSKELKVDKEIIKETYLLVPEDEEKSFFYKLPPKIRNDKKWIISLLKDNSPVYHHLNKNLQEDEKIFETAIMNQYQV